MSGDAQKHKTTAAVKDNQLPAAGVCKKTPPDMQRMALHKKQISPRMNTDDADLQT